MTKLFRDILLGLSLCLIVATAACDNNGCEDNQSSLPLAGFYSSQTKTAVSIDSLTVYGIGAPGDSMIVETSSSITQVYLPFDIDASSSRFVIRYDRKELAAAHLADTITIAYKSRPYFHSKECGAMYVFDVEDYSSSTHLIDSVRIPAATIDNTNKENIRIYFRTEEADEQ